MSAPETAANARDWQEMGRLARAACEVDAARVAGGRQQTAETQMDARQAHMLWRPAVWVLAAATIAELQAELASFQPVNVWDSPDYEVRAGVYYPDERRPDDAVPLYRKTPVRVIGGATPPEPRPATERWPEVTQTADPYSFTVAGVTVHNFGADPDFADDPRRDSKWGYYLPGTEDGWEYGFDSMMEAARAGRAAVMAVSS